MKILVLGGDGMLGHQVLKVLGKRHDIRVTLRQKLNAYKEHKIFNDSNTYAGIDIRNLEQLLEVVSDCNPEAVVNAVGVVKQRTEAKESLPSLEINALFPHRLFLLCTAIGARMVHLSTDCVFSGIKGNYTEGDCSDADDLYGKTKYLGEVTGKGAITLRSSIIGRELSRKASLLEWFLSQHKSVKGFKKAIFSGLTTIEMSRVIERVLVDYPDKYGLYHVSSAPISKYELLKLINSAFNKKLIIKEDEKFICDRSLDSSRFRSEFNYSPPDWETMIEELVKN